MADWTESIRFISLKGDELVFKTETNTLNNSQMFWIEPYKSMYAGSKHLAKKQIKAILKNCKIIKHEKGSLNA